MIKIAKILLIFCLLTLVFSGCTDNNEVSSTNVSETESITLQQIEETEEQESTRLSESCQKIVSTGVDEKGSVWEIVAEVKESAKGSQLLVGVIKDNEWFLEMGTACPFVHQGVYWEEDGGNFDEIACSYVGKQTFACYGIFWNVNSGEWVQYGYANEWDWGNSIEDRDKDGELEFLHRGIIRYSNGKEDSVHTSAIILNIETFEQKKVFLSGIRGIDSFIMRSANDGSFYVYYNESGDVYGWPSARYNVTFYSKNGEELFDLDEYNTDTSRIGHVSPFDDNNLCTITVCLNSGSRFEVVIDTKGNIISETKMQ